MLTFKEDSYVISLVDPDPAFQVNPDPDPVFWMITKIENKITVQLNKKIFIFDQN